jgi:hypothetical protein
MTGQVWKTPWPPFSKGGENAMYRSHLRKPIRFVKTKNESMTDITLPTHKETDSFPEKDALISLT